MLACCCFGRNNAVGELSEGDGNVNHFNLALRVPVEATEALLPDVTIVGVDGEGTHSPSDSRSHTLDLTDVEVDDAIDAVSLTSPFSSSSSALSSKSVRVVDLSPALSRRIDLDACPLVYLEWGATSYLNVGGKFIDAS